MKYEIRPIEAITTDEQVIEVVKQFGAGNFSHAASQAVVWHLQNGMTWSELAAKQRRRLGGVSQPYFTKDQLRRASNIMARVDTILGEKEEDTKSTSRYDSPRQ